ncbi:hypothetical protein LB579_28720 [Mesorhizobium sp. BR1-1-7]|uniref:hypothetical protein n=1 Tax=Mesorhizobium sp. BR1-1-7 TaxID=2876647 RepID=UPI001CCDEC92|nr:hypothetical protein [Mesorhizobium sp. BR1-1-7]MBZ9921684.1 hypothetical protein [Mesorhizobium sp. BR1-1-7]
MRDLPKTIDADVVIEIDRILNDRSKTAPVPVHQLAEMIRTRIVTSLSAPSIEELIVEMASLRGMVMLFDLPDVPSNVVALSDRRPR